MIINQKLIKDIEAYCSLNELNCNEYINKLLRKAFNEDKYGTKPEVLNKKGTFVTEEEPKILLQEETEIMEPLEIKETVTEVSDGIKLVTKKTKTKHKLNE